MNLIDRNTGFRLKGKIEKMRLSDFERLNIDLNFSFNWKKESLNELYAIKFAEGEEILGLMSLIDHPSEFRIHINLLESAISHRGKNKQILNIPGCLIAYACKLSFMNGYNGFVSLIPKTELIEYYINTYGFTKVGRQLAIFDEDSESLIQKFIGNE